MTRTSRAEWLRRLAMVLGAPLLALALVEYVLWVFDVAPPTKPAEAPAARQPMIVEAGWREESFHASLATVPESGRVMCFGGSSMAGAPLERELTMCDMAAEALTPRPVVMNTASSAMDSQDVRLLATAACQHPQRLLLMYSGHNEFLSLENFVRGKPPQALVDASRFLERFRFYRLIQSTVASEEPRRPEEVGLPDISNAEVFARYEANLRAIFEACRGKPLVVGTMVSNQALRYPRQLTVREAHRQGKLGTVPLHDTCRECFRAPDIINLTIERVAAEYGVPVVDMRRLLKGRDPLDLFWDHVHPKPALLRDMAEAFLQTAKEAGYIDSYETPRIDVAPERLRWAAADRAFYNLRFDPILALQWIRETEGFYAPAQHSLGLLVAGFLLDRPDVVREGVAKANQAIDGSDEVRSTLRQCAGKPRPLPCLNLTGPLLMNEDERADLLRQAQQAGANAVVLELLRAF